MENSFWGNTAALVIGGFAIIGGVAQGGSGLESGADLLTSGAVIVLTALAYRSRKRRRLSIMPDTRIRKAIEIVTLVAALLLIVLQNGFLHLLYDDPIPNLVIPAFGFIAYTSVFFAHAESHAQTGNAEEPPKKGVIYTETELKRFRERGHKI